MLTEVALEGENADFRASARHASNFTPGAFGPSAPAMSIGMKGAREAHEKGRLCGLPAARFEQLFGREPGG